MISEIPVGWSIKAVADICDKLQYGLTASANSSSDIGPKFLRITDITQSGVNWDKVPYCECQIDQIEKFGLFNNDILFARIGGTTGKSFIVKNPPQSVFASYLIRLRVLSEEDNPNYLISIFNLLSIKMLTLKKQPIFPKGYMLLQLRFFLAQKLSGL